MIKNLFKILFITIFLFGCQEESNFWEDCERLDQGLVTVHNETGVKLYVDVTQGTAEQNAPIDLPAIDGTTVCAQFQEIYKGEVKVWFSLYEDFTDKKIKRVEVTPCENTDCIIYLKDLR